MEKPGIRPITIKLTSYTTDVRYFWEWGEENGNCSSWFWWFY